MRAVGLGAVASLLLACGGGGASAAAGGEALPPPPITPITEPPDATSPGAFVEARATAPSEEAAEAQAQAALRERVLGDAAGLTARAIHDPARDPRRVSRTPAGVEVWLGLAEERVREHLAAAAAEPTPPPSLPAPLGPAIEVLCRASLQRGLCERQRALLGGDCALVDLGPLERQVQALATEVRVRGAYEGGVPVGVDGRPLRSAAVVVEHRAADRAPVPLPGVPVVARAEPDGPVVARAFTDEQGRAELRVGRDEPLAGPLLVELDPAALSGALAALWPEHRVRLPARPPSVRRWAAVADERVSGRAAPDGGFLEGVHAAMRREVSRSPMPLDDETRARLLRASADARARLLSTHVDEWAGRVDYLLVGRARSEFASRMGQSRVWYEAQGTLEAVDVWTGRSVARVEASVTAPGLGDERAARAAHRALGETLVERLLSALRTSDRLAHATGTEPASP